MDTSDQFKRAEEEYQRLKGLLAAGRMSQEEYDSAVKKLLVRDDQGQTWSLAENGFWQKHDGPPAAPIVQSTRPSPRAAPAATPRSIWPFAVALIAGFVALVCLIGFAGLVYRSNYLGPSVAQAPTLSPSLTPTLVVIPSAILVTPTAVSIAPSATAPASPTIQLPEPTATVDIASATIQLQTPTEIVDPTIEPPSASGSVTTTLSVPPGLYVTGLRLDPPTPARKVDVQFFASFSNTTKADIESKWVVFVFKVEDLNHALGQTTTVNGKFPIGDSELKTQGWKLVGGGGCLNLMARVALTDGKKATFLKQQDGSLFQTPFSVC